MSKIKIFDDTILVPKVANTWYRWVRDHSKDIERVPDDFVSDLWADKIYPYIRENYPVIDNIYRNSMYDSLVKVFEPEDYQSIKELVSVEIADSEYSLDQVAVALTRYANYCHRFDYYDWDGIAFVGAALMYEDKRELEIA